MRETPLTYLNTFLLVAFMGIIFNAFAHHGWIPQSTAQLLADVLNAVVIFVFGTAAERLLRVYADGKTFDRVWWVIVAPGLVLPYLHHFTPAITTPGDRLVFAVAGVAWLYAFIPVFVRIGPITLKERVDGTESEQRMEDTA